MNSDRKSQARRRRQTRSAWRVFLKRPLAIWVLLSVTTLVALIPVFLAEGEKLRSNTPRRVHKLIDADELMGQLKSGSTNQSIVGLNLTRSESMPGGIDRFLLQFPNVRELQLSGDQLSRIAPGTFEKLRELTSVWLVTTDLREEEVERLSQIASLQHLALWASSYDADLSPLKRNRLLEYVELHGPTTTRRAGRVPVFSQRQLRELVQIPTLQTIALRSPTILTSTTLDGTRLTDSESQAVAQVADILASSPTLRTLYAGAQNTGASRQAARELRAALPAVSVRPAEYISEFWEKLMLSVFVSIFAVGIAALHYVSCCCLPQSVLVPDSQAGHSRVVCRVVFILVAIQVTFLMVVLEAHVLAATSVSVACLAIASAILNMCLAFDKAKAGRDALTGIVVILTFVASVFLAMVYVDRVEWFVFGEQPAIAITIIAVSIAMIYPVTRRFQIHRLWVEHGIAPAAGMQSLMTNLMSRNLAVINSATDEATQPVPKTAGRSGWRS